MVRLVKYPTTEMTELLAELRKSVADLRSSLKMLSREGERTVTRQNAATLATMMWHALKLIKYSTVAQSCTPKPIEPALGSTKRTRLLQEEFQDALAPADPQVLFHLPTILRKLNEDMTPATDFSYRDSLFGFMERLDARVDAISARLDELEIQFVKSQPAATSARLADMETNSRSVFQELFSVAIQLMLMHRLRIDLLTLEKIDQVTELWLAESSRTDPMAA